MADFVYIDETGTTAFHDKRQPILTVVAAIVPEDHVQPLAVDLKKIANEAIDDFLPRKMEFHGNELWAGRGPWKGMSPSELLDVYKAVIDLIDSHDVSVAHASINKQKLYANYAYPESPYLLGLQYLCEKVDSLSGRKVLIADEAKEHELRAIGMVSGMQQWGGSGIVPGRTLKHIIDTLHFVRSYSSPGVQLADMIGFMLHRDRDCKESHPDATAAVREMKKVIDDATATCRAVWP